MIGTDEYRAAIGCFCPRAARIRGPYLEDRLITFLKLVKHYVFDLACNITSEHCAAAYSTDICAQVLKCLLIIGNVEQNPGPSQCCVRGCHNKYGRTDVKKSYFTFPKDEVKCKAWVENMPQAQKEGWTPGKNSVICEDHFVGGK